MKPRSSAKISDAKLLQADTVLEGLEDYFEAQAMPSNRVRLGSQPLGERGIDSLNPSIQSSAIALVQAEPIVAVQLRPEFKIIRGFCLGFFQGWIDPRAIAC